MTKSHFPEQFWWKKVLAWDCTRNDLERCKIPKLPTDLPTMCTLHAFILQQHQNESFKTSQPDQVKIVAWYLSKILSSTSYVKTIQKYHKKSHTYLSPIVCILTDIFMHRIFLLLDNCKIVLRCFWPVWEWYISLTWISLWWGKNQQQFKQRMGHHHEGIFLL